MAIIDGKVAVIGDLASVKSAIDTKGAGAFADEPGPKAAFAAADGSHLGLVYMALGKLFDWSASLQKSMHERAAQRGARPRDRRLRSVDDDLDDDRPAARNGRRSRSRRTRTPSRFESISPPPAKAVGPTADRTSDLVKHIPASAIALAVTHDYGATLQQAHRPLQVAAVLQGRRSPSSRSRPTWPAALDAILGWIGDTGDRRQRHRPAARGGHRGQGDRRRRRGQAPDQPQGPRLARWRPAGHQRPRGGPRRHDDHDRQPGLHRQARRVARWGRRPRSRSRAATSSSPGRSRTTSSSSAAARASSSTCSTPTDGTSLAERQPLQGPRRARRATAPGSPSSTSRTIRERDRGPHHGARPERAQDLRDRGQAVPRPVRRVRRVELGRRATSTSSDAIITVK